MLTGGRHLSGNRLDRGLDRENFQGHGSGVSWGRPMVGGGSGRKTVAKRHRARV
jgi:hypothetical protein